MYLESNNHKLFPEILDYVNPDFFTLHIASYNAMQVMQNLSLQFAICIPGSRSGNVCHRK
jgi:hypothetical protein